MENEQKYKLLPVAKRLWKNYISKYIGVLIATALLLLITSAATSLQPILIQQAFDRIFKDHDMYYLQVIPLAILGIFAVQAVTLYFSNILMARMQNGMIADLRKDLYGHIINNEIDFHARNDSGNLIARVTAEVQLITNGVATFFNAWCRQVITSIGLIFVMFYQSWELSLISLTAFAFAFYPLRRVTVRLKKLSRQFAESNTHLSSRLLESFAGIRIVKAFGKEDFEVGKVSGYIDRINELANKQMRVASVTPPMMQILAGLAVAFVIWYGGHELMAGNMTQGNLVAFITSLLMVSRPIRSITSTGSMMMNAYVSSQRYFDVIDSKPLSSARDVGAKLQPSEGRIVFDKVDFSYTGSELALKSLNIDFMPGKTTALVGHSGSGKSTIFNLLLKFYDVNNGHITIDGQNITGTSVKSVRENISLVSQDIFIFDDTAFNNIAYGKEGATKEEVVAAAKAAKCHDFISALPESYETKLGFFGQSLSGGQKQRIALARAFLRNSPILLLDEATSALDTETETEIQAAIDKLTENRTTIIIAHRLSAVIKADDIIMLGKGQMVARGKHEELVNNPAYARLFGV